MNVTNSPYRDRLPREVFLTKRKLGWNLTKALQRGNLFIVMVISQFLLIFIVDLPTGHYRAIPIRVLFVISFLILFLITGIVKKTITESKWE